MSRQGLTGKRAVWLGMLGTPALLIAAIMLIGVTAGSAGPSTTAAQTAPAATTQSVSGVTTHTTALGAGTQTLAELKAYWTPERMAAAQPYPMPTPSASAGTPATAPVSAPLNLIQMQPDGTVLTGTAPSSTQPLHETLHADIPFSQWQYFAKYLPNSPGGGSNVAASTQHKMFFSQNGGNFVCSSSTVGVDAVWTAGHCVSDGSNTFSTNVLFCPSFDNGFNPTAGCWGSESITVSTAWHTAGDIDRDIGGADASDNPVSGPQSGLIGNFTGILGFAYNPVAEGTTAAPNLNYVSFGYPAAAPFNGNKIQVCTSSHGYVDDGVAGGQASKAIGCDMTGGSSGGPWLISMGLPGQPGGGTPGFPSCCNFVHGHNDWRHTVPDEPNEMNSPSFNCLALFVWRSINDIALGTCP